METKKVYIYADKGNEYVGDLTLDDSDKSPSGKWNIPGFCTEAEPPEQKEGFDIMWNGSGWAYKEIPKEPSEPEPTLDELKVTKVNQMKAERNAREQEPIEYNGKTFDYDSLSRERLALARQAIEDSGLNTVTIKWTCADNTFINLGIEDFKKINAIAAERSTGLHDTYNKLKVLINACTTKEELDSISFDADVSSISYGE